VNRLSGSDSAKTDGLPRRCGDGVNDAQKTERCSHLRHHAIQESGFSFPDGFRLLFVWRGKERPILDLDDPQPLQIPEGTVESGGVGVRASHDGSGKAVERPCEWRCAGDKGGRHRQTGWQNRLQGYCMQATWCGVLGESGIPEELG